MMKAKFAGCWKTASRTNLTLALGLVLAGWTASAALAELAMPQRSERARPTSTGLCAGEIPMSAPLPACLRRQKANLSDAYQAVFEQ
jgi:hypothetical protein